MASESARVALPCALGVQVGNVTLVNIGRRYEPGTEDAYGKDLALLSDIVRQGCRCGSTQKTPEKGYLRVAALRHPALPPPEHLLRRISCAGAKCVRRGGDAACRGCILVDTLPGHFPTVTGAPGSPPSSLSRQVDASCACSPSPFRPLLPPAELPSSKTITPACPPTHHFL